MGAPWPPQPSPRPALSHQHLPGITLVAIAGELDRANSAQLAGYLDRVHRLGDHVVFDLTELTFLDSSGLHVLLSRARICAAAGAGTHLAGAHGAPARLLKITGVDGHLPLHPTVEEAVIAVLTARRGRSSS
jgi:anti-sigma B factor antagonist